MTKDDKLYEEDVKIYKKEHEQWVAEQQGLLDENNINIKHYIALIENYKKQIKIISKQDALILDRMSIAQAQYSLWLKKIKGNKN